MSSGQLELLKKVLAPHYQFERELGQGAFASVFLARDLRHERSVAIKVLRVEPSTELNEIRFLREIRFLASLQHPNIVPVHDSGHVEDLLYYVMPYVKGETVRERIRRERQLPVTAAVSIASEVSDALDYAHRQGVIHRDIKPENILLSGHHAMLADFGVARFIDSARGTQITRTGLGSPGTPAYMSPEQILGERHVDSRTDIYSLGCVLYETLTGKAPFEGPSGFAKRFTEPAPSAKTLRPEISDALDQTIARALRRTPDERFTTGAEMCEALTASTKVSTPVVSSRPLATAARLSSKQPVGDGGGPILIENATDVPAWNSGRRIALLGVIALVLVLGAGRIIDSRTGAALETPYLDPRRVAVLDFEDQSPDQTLGHIASGLAVSLRRELSGVNALQVLSRNSVKSFQSRGVSVDSTVTALRVGSLIEGSVQRSNDKLRLTVQMIDARSHTQLESATIERGLGELFLLEDDLAHQVAMILRRRLGVVFRVHETLSGTKSSRARELVFRADKLRQDAEADAVSLNPADFANAQSRLFSADSLLALAEKADSRWAAPIIDRGWIALSLAQGETERPRMANFEQAIAHANRAMNRNPENPLALELRGTALYWQVIRVDMPDADFSDRLTRASADLTKALAADSSLATAWGTLSLVRYARGDVANAERAARTALAMDTYLKDAPRILAALYTSNLMKGSFRDASKWCEAGARDYPQAFYFLECQLTLLAEDPNKPPDVAKAHSLAAQANELDPPERAKGAGRPYNPIYRQMMVAMVLARAGNRDSAHAIARRARGAVASDTSLHSDFLYDDAYLNLLVGRRQETLRLLTEYLTLRPSLRALVGRHQRWRPLWSDTSFVSLTTPSKRE
jgi:serine/threonine-protein kinase